jgi:sorbitol/mannitol transport system permease protein
MNKLQRKALTTVIGWTVALVLFFPIFWMILTSFKTEREAISQIPHFFFSPTLQNYKDIQERADWLHFAWNSVVVSVGSTLSAIALAIPAAYTLAFQPGSRTRGTLLWMLSTKMMPSAGVLVPVYLICRDMNLLDTQICLLAIYTLMNLPIVVWMIYTFFKEVPREILEASRMDGAGPVRELVTLLLPLSMPGIVSTSLLAIILSWNEAFWSLNLTATKAAPLSAYIATFSSPQGLFYGKLSAASTLAIAPILIFGWLTQKQLVRGLTFGAVK